MKFFRASTPTGAEDYRRVSSGRCGDDTRREEIRRPGEGGSFCFFFLLEPIFIEYTQSDTRFEVECDRANRTLKSLFPAAAVVGHLAGDN